MRLRVLLDQRDYLPLRLFLIYLPCLTFSIATKARNYTSIRYFRPDGGKLNRYWRRTRFQQAQANKPALGF